MVKLRLTWHYYKSTQRFNLPISLIAGLTGIIFNPHFVVGAIDAFSLCLLTGGFLLALYLYEQRHAGQYYFYYNRGLSKVSLMVASYGLNVVLVILLFLLKLFLYRYV
ncbi:hypothetical protein CLV24_101138 [Pontibacter ummariensis]|uniref:Uncharacterized protein n=1 Tax=Pontibacter ummariensis TaxID=1610492 RepID=A0A239B625_9BACT|nr:hypothetical protein [Pontibacter ummariensis]PRY16293.1 hypothetical protein CLV24_101138 [Pontibacter ummariensis]SNS02664.1 hypothetical protein SAMN06296052_101138 [Pontibacter ummariensis]